MSIVKITQDLIESVTLTTHPKRTFVSSSQNSVNVEPLAPSGISSPTGTLGQVSLMARTNRAVKGIMEFDPESSLFNEDQAALLINLASAAALSGTTTDIHGYLGGVSPRSGADGGKTDWTSNDVDAGYMKGVRTLKRPSRNSKVFNVTRFRPPFVFQNIGSGSNQRLSMSSSFAGKHRIVKNQVRNILLPTHRGQYFHPNYAYTNYHTLNFFTSSNGDQIADNVTGTMSSVLIYPCPTGSLNSIYTNPQQSALRRKRFDGKYAPESAFTFDFYINPRYTNDTTKGLKKGEFKPGTIFHMSAAYAVSLVTGSSKAADGSADGYRLLLQLSQSAEYAPSKFKVIKDSDRPIFLGSAGNYKAEPFKYAWLSPDNSLKKNHWHHVAIRWSPKVNLGTGSFVIDGNEVSEFYIPSASIRPIVNQNTKAETSAGRRAIGDRFPAGRADPNALFIGNFYEGTNLTGSNATTIERFFNQTARKNEGFTVRPDISSWNNRTDSDVKESPSISPGDPYRFSFNHPLNAEVHDLKIFKTYRTIPQILTSSAMGPEDLSDLLFYVPPFYTYEKHDRRFLSNAVSSSRKQDFQDTGGASYDDGPGDYPVDAFAQAYTSMPFNAGLSMTVDATLINLECFTKDIVNNVYPRLLFLTASASSDKIAKGSSFVPSVTGRRVSEYLFQTASIVKRCLSVLPNDNGRFQPNYALLYTGSDRDEVITSGSEGYPYRDDLGNFNPSLINLSDVFVTPHADISLVSYDDSGNGILDSLAYLSGAFNFPSPDNPSGDVSNATGFNPFLSYQASRDKSSNEIVLFNIPNLFYGNRIEPGTFTLTDENLTGSRGKIGITLKDDGHGSLYRSDCLTAQSTYNCVGNIFYEEGIVLIKSPHLAYFGKDQFKMSFNGEQNIHVMSVSIPCQPGLINSSSNPVFKVLSASLDANDTDSKFVYITGIYLHDDNMNVIMKMNLAQPVVKRDDDDFLFRVKMDF